MLSHVTCSSLPLLQTVREKVNVTNCSRDPHTQLECHNSQQTSQPPLFSHFHKFHRVSCMTFSKHQYHRWTAAGSLLVAHVTMIHDLKKKKRFKNSNGSYTPSRRTISLATSCKSSTSRCPSSRSVKRWEMWLARVMTSQNNLKRTLNRGLQLLSFSLSRAYSFYPVTVHISSIDYLRHPWLTSPIEPRGVTTKMSNE